MYIFNKQSVLIAATVFVVACSQDEPTEISKSSRAPGDLKPVPALAGLWMLALTLRRSVDAQVSRNRR